ncbi:hypothetical protein NA56DRAFT_709238 [Hyaloscypha hepaticicola]|uniref:Uncharacterized protein n=1 Tax=Hyaloscypha hepaticicola TaxID=2082293 RepID=A0A2J6PQ46_9HELO|nr:hypothetical protein NA56DRAFT_709238 [Hyaloscypha hepaticicola]
MSSTAEQSTSEQRHLDILTLRATPANDIKKKAKKWEITTGNPALSKRKRSTFTNTKRRKVSEVRQRGACEYHRTKKLECNPPCPHLQTKITKPPEQFLEDLPAIECGGPVEPSIATAATTEGDLEGTYDFNSFLRISAKDPAWNDIFEQTPANYAPMNDPWLPFENFPT